MSIPNIRPGEPLEHGSGDAAAIIQAAREGAEVRQLKRGEIHAIPSSDGEPKVLDLTGPAHLFRAGLPLPAKQGTVKLSDGASLVAYAELQGGVPPSLYADREGLTVVAVFDDDDSNGPGWRTHRAVVTYRRSTAWACWTGASGSYNNQEAFAEFLEDRAADVVSPTAAHLIEVVTSIQATVGAKIESSTRLADGQVRLSYVETVEARAGKLGQLSIPETFELGLKPLEGGETYRVKARLRWRRRDGGVMLSLVINDPQQFERNAFDREIEKLQAAMPGVPVMFGTPAPCLF